MVKPKDDDQAPTSLPSTPPPSVSGDITSWLLNASNKSEGTLGRIEGDVASIHAQLGRIELKLDAVEKEVQGHGRWMHTLKFFAAVIVFLIGWVVANAVWPWLKARVGIPGG